VEIIITIVKSNISNISKTLSVTIVKLSLMLIVLLITTVKNLTYQPLVKLQLFTKF